MLAADAACHARRVRGRFKLKSTFRHTGRTKDSCCERRDRDDLKYVKRREGDGFDKQAGSRGGYT